MYLSPFPGGSPRVIVWRNLYPDALTVPGGHVTQPANQMKDDPWIDETDPLLHSLAARLLERSDVSARARSQDCKLMHEFSL